MKPKMPPKHKGLARPAEKDLPTCADQKMGYTDELRKPKHTILEPWLDCGGNYVNHLIPDSLVANGKRYILRVVGAKPTITDPAMQAMTHCGKIEVEPDGVKGWIFWPPINMFNLLRYPTKPEALAAAQLWYEARLLPALELVTE